MEEDLKIKYSPDDFNLETYKKDIDMINYAFDRALSNPERFQAGYTYIKIITNKAREELKGKGFKVEPDTSSPLKSMYKVSWEKEQA